MGCRICKSRATNQIDMGKVHRRAIGTRYILFCRNCVKAFYRGTDVTILSLEGPNRDRIKIKVEEMRREFKELSIKAEKGRAEMNWSNMGSTASYSNTTSVGNYYYRGIV